MEHTDKYPQTGGGCLQSSFSSKTSNEMSDLDRPTCVFCTAPVLPRTTTTATIIKEDGTTVTVIVKTEDVEGAGSGFILSESDMDAEGDGHIQKDLKSIFIVQKLLGLPEGKCEQFLQRKEEGYPRPGSWFAVCGKCDGCVKEFYQAYRQAINLERKLMRMKADLVDLIRESNVRNKGVVKRRLSDDIRSCALELAGSARMKPPTHPDYVKAPSVELAPISKRPKRKLSRVNYANCDALPFQLNDTIESPRQISIDEDTNEDNEWGLSEIMKDEPEPSPIKMKVKLAKRSRMDNEEKAGNTEKKKSAHVFGNKKDSEILQMSTDTDETQEQEVGGTPYYCDHCYMIFKSIYWLQKHCSIYHRKEPLTLCRRCSLSFLTKQLLEIHIEEVHPELKTTADENSRSESNDREMQCCSYCARSFVSKSNLDYHIADIHPLSLLKCNSCGLQSSKFSSHVKHMKRKHKTTDFSSFARNDHPIKEVQPKCESVPCSVPYTGLPTFEKIDPEQNTATVTSSTSKILLENGQGCTSGDEDAVQWAESPSPKSIKEDVDDPDWSPLMKNGNVEASPPLKRRRGRPVKDKDLAGLSFRRNACIYKCTRCPAVFRTKSLFVNHRNLHANNTGSECPHCGWRCEEHKMGFHIGKRHPDSKFKKKFKSPMGKKTKTYKYIYKQPFYEEIPYYCDHCQMILTSLIQFERHCRTYHMSMPKVSCSKCAVEFFSKQLLQIHTDDIHPEFKKTDDGSGISLKDDIKSDCPHCSMTFVSKLKLDFHIAKVHPLSLLKCKVCSYQAKEFNLLNIHIKRRHGRTSGDENAVQCAESPSPTSIMEDIDDPDWSPSMKKGDTEASPPLKRRRGRPVKEKDLARLSLRRDACIYKCTRCPAVFRAKSLFVNHRNLHANNTGSKCPHCGWLCEERKMGFHIGKRHPDSKFKKKFKSPMGTKTKTYKHIYKRPFYEEIPYYCDHCQMINTSLMRFERHCRMYHTKMSKVSCSKCAAEFFSKQLLQIHTDDIHPELKKSDDGSGISLKDDIKSDCPHCSMTFLSKLKLDFHIAKVHPLSLLKCKVCSYQAKEFNLLNIHIERMHTNSNQKDKIVCEVCSATFNDKSMLRRHMTVSHYKELGLDPLKCPNPKCHSVFPSKKHLEVHNREVHGNKDFCCEYCGKVFSRKPDLRKHVLLHTAPRELQYKKGPFICEYCPTAVFNVRQGLYYHMKKAHNDKYLFRCPKCGMGYALEKNLRQHETTCKENDSEATTKKN